MTQRIHDGEVALISGGLGDIGWAISTLLADQGADIALCDLVPENEVHVRLDDLRARGTRVDYTTVDVGSPVEVKRWVRGVAERLGVPSMTIPNAAIVAYCSALSTSPEDFNRHLKINLLGAFFMAQEAARILIEHKAAGRIVFIGSCVAHAPSPQILPYAGGVAHGRPVHGLGTCPTPDSCQRNRPGLRRCRAFSPGIRANPRLARGVSQSRADRQPSDGKRCGKKSGFSLSPGCE
jgi:NADP-dependent 3-hydroxy acid dehydrogenase YdfG